MITYSTYRPEHKAQIIDLIIDIQQNEFRVPITLADQPDLQMISDFYQVKNGNFWVALHEEKVVGTIALIDCGDGIACLRKMFIHKDFRSKHGIAQELLDTLIAATKAHDFKAIYLGTRAQLEAAIRFYERNNFQPIAIPDLPPQFPRMAVDTHFFELKLEIV